MEEMISTTRSTSRSWSAIGMIPVRKLSLLCLYAIIIATGQTLFDALSTVLSERGIPWSNVVGFYSDSASVMVGRRNSVLSRVLNEQPQVFSLGCICHLAALCAAAGLKALPVSIDNLLIDMFYHFKHSSKRVHEFKEILADFSDIAPMRVLKHCTTRWLSLDRAVERLIAMIVAYSACILRPRKGT